MKQENRRKLITFITVASLVITTAGFTTACGTQPQAPEPEKLYTGTDVDGAKVSIDWNTRYHYEDLQQQFKDLAKAYPDLSELTTIGKSTEERDLMCMTITDPSVKDEKKTKAAVFGCIHGSEGESASCAMYAAWYLLENSADKQVADLLKNNIVYVIPVINPDGYEESFVYRTRECLEPMDHDGDGVPFNDGYEDINGDGMIGTVYAIDPETSEITGIIGEESKDANRDGILGNDPRNGEIDLNRNFDYHWDMEDPYYKKGPSAASEPETQAIQEFIDEHSDLNCFVTLHSGYQSVLYPWCWQAASDDPDNADDLAFMREAAGAIAKACAAGTHRNFYARQSYDDYQTFSEMIDYAYGLYGIHGYTIEVCCQGTYEWDGVSSEYDENYDPLELADDMMAESICCWNNTLPEDIIVDYTHEEALELFEKNGIDPKALVVTDVPQYDAETGEIVESTRNWKKNEGIRIYTAAVQQMCGKAPEDQDEMVTGIMDGILAMLDSEK